ncbi:hypothetical protein Bca4012_026667 [Brassica carinata]
MSPIRIASSPVSLRRFVLKSGRSPISKELVVEQKQLTRSTSIVHTFLPC